jgi:hypothetical protein
MCLQTFDPKNKASMHLANMHLTNKIGRQAYRNLTIKHLAKINLAQQIGHQTFY